MDSGTIITNLLTSLSLSLSLSLICEILEFFQTAKHPPADGDDALTSKLEKRHRPCVGFMCVCLFVFIAAHLYRVGLMG